MHGGAAEGGAGAEAGAQTGRVALLAPLQAGHKSTEPAGVQGGMRKCMRHLRPVVGVDDADHQLPLLAPVLAWEEGRRRGVLGGERRETV